MDYREDLKSALKTLREGGVILYPTDTIWGLGCDATRQEAVEKIFRIKQRPDEKSLIILVNGYGMLERYVAEIPDAAANIIEVADSPITIIYPRGRNLAPGVCNDDGSVGIRICINDFCSELITMFRKPLVSTSANISGKPAPGIFRQIGTEILGSVDYIVKYRQEEEKKNPPSSVIKVENNGVIQIIRS